MSIIKAAITGLSMALPFQEATAQSMGGLITEVQAHETHGLQTKEQFLIMLDSIERSFSYFHNEISTCMEKEYASDQAKAMSIMLMEGVESNIDILSDFKSSLKSMDTLPEDDIERANEILEILYKGVNTLQQGINAQSNSVSKFFCTDGLAL